MTPALQVPGDLRAELDRPAADGLVADIDAALSQQLLDVPEAQVEPKIQPHRVADHVRREAVSFERKRSHEPQPDKGSQAALSGDLLALD